MHPTIAMTAVAIFDDRPSAERAVCALRDVGFHDGQVALTVRDPAGPAPPADGESMETVGEGAGVGAVAGASLGGLAGGTLLGLVAGGLAGGLVGALVGLGVPEAEAHYYQAQLDAGRALVTVQTDGRYDEAMDVLRRFGGRPAEPPESRAGPGVLP